MGGGFSVAHGKEKTMTLAQFKRDAAKGNMYLELVERYGKSGNDIPENLQGLRGVKRINSVSVYLQGRGSIIESELRLKRATLVEYDGKTLTVYQPALRDPNEQEQALLDQWDKIQDEYMLKNPFGDPYWKRKAFFETSPFPYMSGYDSCQGKSYESHLGKVRDSHIRGEAILKYTVYFGEMATEA